MTLKNNLPIEILAPVGALDMVSAAVYCGANAIYLGFSSLNARKKAQDFDLSTLKYIINFCHLRDVKVFLTLNTLIFDDEINTAKDIIISACNLGIDAIIVQDLAVAKLALKIAPTMALHGSTQMSIGSVRGALQLEKMGFKRLVLARELSKNQIKDIVNATNMEVEVFIHGAHCYSVSGQCYMSSFIGARSGNRGNCAQPCRLPFSQNKNGNEHNLSLKDLSIIEHIDELAEIGVTSVKIEGRMKRPEYVAAAVSACVAKRDKKDFDSAFKDLKAVFSRSGFTDGFYKNQIDENMYGIRVKADVQAAKKVFSKLQNLYHKETPLVEVEMSYIQKKDEPITLLLSDFGGLNGKINKATATGATPELAISNPTTKEKAEKSLMKLGQTPFYVNPDNIVFDMDEKLMVRMSDVNDLRRQAVDELSAKKIDGFAKSINDFNILENEDFTKYRIPKFRARFQNVNAIPFKLFDLLEYIYIPDKILALNKNLFKGYEKKIIIETPRVNFVNEQILIDRLEILKNSGFNNLEANSLASVLIGNNLKFNLFGGFGLNILNSLSISEYEKLNIKETTLSVEIDLKSIKKLNHNIMPLGVIAYGHLPAMITRNCPGKAVLKCKDCNKNIIMFDRLNNKYAISCENYDNKAFSEIYNPYAVYMADKMEDLNCIDFITLYFTNEDKDTTEKVFNNYYKSRGKLFIENITRGLFYRPII